MKTIIKNRTLIGEVLLSLLLVSALIWSILIQTKTLVIILLSIFFFLLTISIVYKHKNSVYEEKKPTVKLAFDMGAIFISGLVVYLFENYLNISYLIMVPVIGLIGSLLFISFENALYLGSFLGMTSIDIGYFFIVLTLASLAYFFFEDAYSGFGGKLGSSAFFFGLIIAFFIKGGTVVNYNDVEIYLVVIAAVIATLLTTVIQRTYNLSTVLVSAFISLVGAVFLFIPKFDYGVLIASAILGASFVGMTLKEHLHIFLVFAAALLFAFLFVFIPFNGIGGRLGFTAFLSVMIVMGVKNSFSFAQKKK
ncbi:MAG: hypothetical protein RBS76_01285 [Acholeplasmatales bacterium]|jgi:hypothetical protein|nr:hypothetical protein [Acholeplasmataceae bacterium]MDY0115113.1 hypothetical protein [Acholeplasmatales bacterium]MCK9233809.1 hypothetical protein [Acholeplasmataceae bacterium]MCK9289300.1 hypothetical protein [Acholeplasmataceae bacterium]MCK9427204.1 hypothetical protein [Acholeplasmataceae bacterium]